MGLDIERIVWGVFIIGFVLSMVIGAVMVTIIEFTVGSLYNLRVITKGRTKQ